MQGLLALVLRSSFLLGLHVVLGAMLGAAIAAYDASVFDNQDFRSALLYVATAGPCASHCVPPSAGLIHAGISSWAERLLLLCPLLQPQGSLGQGLAGIAGWEGILNPPFLLPSPAVAVAC